MGLLASVIVLAVLVFEWTTAAAFSPLRVSAFNIRVFGITKITRDDVRDTLVKVRCFHSPTCRAVNFRETSK